MDRRESSLIESARRVETKAERKRREAERANRLEQSIADRRKARLAKDTP